MQVRFRLPPYLPTAVILCATLWLTLSPRPIGGMRIHLFDNQDKVAHALMFGLLVVAWCYDRYRLHHRPAPWIAALVVIALGGAIELIQEALAMGRTAEWADFAADIVGAIVGALIWKYCHTDSTHKL